MDLQYFLHDPFLQWEGIQPQGAAYARLLGSGQTICHYYQTQAVIDSLVAPLNVTF